MSSQATAVERHTVRCSGGVDSVNLTREESVVDAAKTSC